MRVLVAYDIADNKRRRRIEALLRKEISRAQESVFVGHIEEHALQQLVDTIRKNVNEQEDALFVLRICKGCHEALIEIGQSSIGQDEICISLF